MTPNLMNKRKTQLLALVSVIILIGMGMTVLLSPSEGDPSPYMLNLTETENAIHTVAVPPATPSCTIFEMELFHTLGSGSFVGEIQLEVLERVYYENSAMYHWTFTFLDDNLDPVVDNTYNIPAEGFVIVNLEVCFIGSTYGEKVTFTIGGHNVTSNQKNETHLSPRDGPENAYEYLTVVAGRECEPFWEPTTDADWTERDITTFDTYSITLWNLGVIDPTFISILGYQVWMDVNENGYIDGGDVENDYFSLAFLVDGLPFTGVSLGQMMSQDVDVVMTPDPDREKVPLGHYLVEITIQSDCDVTFTGFLQACVCEVDDNPEPCELKIHLGYGWNLISVGVGLDELGKTYTASTFADEINKQAGQNIIKYVVRYEKQGPLSGEFQEYVVKSDIGTDFPINEGEGYYLFSTAYYDFEFVIVGDCPDDETFDLTECWNLVGYRSTKTVAASVWAYDMDQYATVPIIQAIVKYDKDKEPEEDYAPWYPGSPGTDDFDVGPGGAYWIFSATDITGVPYP